MARRFYSYMRAINASDDSRKARRNKKLLFNDYFIFWVRHFNPLPAYVLLKKIETFCNDSADSSFACG